MSACRICGNIEGNTRHYPRELMFGTGEVFEYVECAQCRCLQISRIPENIGAHYPADYYSFDQVRQKKQNTLLGWLRRARSRHFLGQWNLIGVVPGLLSAPPEYFGWFRAARLSTDSSILDIGCGSGRLLMKLQREGFSDLLGVDPYIEKSIDHGNGVRILKQGLDGLNRKFDFLMLNHSFEHMADPKNVMRSLRRLVNDSGMLMLRIPVADCYARRKYGIHWVGWDAPRHFYLHSVRSIDLLARESGFVLEKVLHDSTIAQIIGSELYLRGEDRPSKAKFELSKRERGTLERFVRELNQRYDGDTVALFLKPN